MNATIPFVAKPLVSITATMLLLSGCASMTNPPSTIAESDRLWDKMPWSEKKEDTPEPYPNPVKIATTWTPDTLTQSGRTPTRGFGARVFFYDEKSRPVAVDGTLIVHGFDEEAIDPRNATKRYEFTPEQFTRHFSQSDLGASYSVWVPWDAVGNKQTRVSLVASFRTKDGRVIQSTPSKVLLPGATDSSGAALAARFSPQYRRYQMAASGELPPSSGLATTTIQRRSPDVRASTITDPPVAPATAWNVASTHAPVRSAEVVMKRDTDSSSPGRPTGKLMNATHRLPSAE